MSAARKIPEDFRLSRNSKEIQLIILMMSSSDLPTSKVISKPWKSVFRDGLFTGKTALVTGGGTGLGYAIAKELALLGATVIIASRRLETCQAAAHELNAWLQQQQKFQNYPSVGRVIAGPSTSIRKEEEIQALVAFCIAQGGGLDLLVNNAGGQFVCPSEDLSRRGFAAVVETNLIGTFLVCREAYNQYMQEHGGSIVNITLCNRNGEL